jgi:hypothetical protein
VMCRPSPSLPAVTAGGTGTGVATGRSRPCLASDQEPRSAARRSEGDATEATGGAAGDRTVASHENGQQASGTTTECAVCLDEAEGEMVKRLQVCTSSASTCG